MYLFLVLLDRSDAPEKAVERLSQFQLPAPIFLRARSTAAALSAEVPMFAGLRGLALGADDDRTVLLCLHDVPAAEAERLVTRIQLEMDADDPPMGRIVAWPVLGSLGTALRGR